MYPYVPVLTRLDPNGLSGCVRTYLEGFGDVPILTEKNGKSDRKNGKMEMGSTRQIWHPYVSVPTRIDPNPSRLTFQICTDPYGRLL